jgi:hypothetical protein
VYGLRGGFCEHAAAQRVLLLRRWRVVSGCMVLTPSVWFAQRLSIAPGAPSLTPSARLQWRGNSLLRVSQPPGRLPPSGMSRTACNAVRARASIRHPHTPTSMRRNQPPGLPIAPRRLGAVERPPRAARVLGRAPPRPYVRPSGAPV